MTFGAPGTGDAARPATPLDRWWHELRTAVAWRRRLLAAGLLAGSVAFGLHALAPPPPPRAAVVVAARDLPAGRPLGPEDVRVAQLPRGAVPAGALTSTRAVSGASVATAVRRGEVLTDVRLAGAAALRGLGPGLVAAPVRLADDGTAALLRPGDVVDVLAAGADDGSAARLVASAARVLGVPAPSGAGQLAGSGTLVLLATSSATAARLAAAAVTDRLSVVLRAS